MFPYKVESAAWMHNLSRLHKADCHRIPDFQQGYQYAKQSDETNKNFI